MSSNSSAASTPGALQANPKTIVGPIFVGNLLNWLLLGTLFVQIYIYAKSTHSRKDPLWARLLVCCVFIIDFGQSLVQAYEVWYFTLDHWGQTDVIAVLVPWSGELIPVLDGVVSWMVQSFYAWRIWTLTRTPYLRTLAVVIGVVALMQFAASAAATITIFRANGSASSLARIQSSIDTWLAGSFANDMIIAGCMIWLLYQARSRTLWVQSQNLYDRLIINALRTGLVTAVVAGVDLFLWEHYRTQNYHLTPAIILGKLYSNAFVSTLNGRVFRNTKNSSQKDTSTGSSGSTAVGVQIHVSQEREHRIDEQAETARVVTKGGRQLAAWKPKTSSTEDEHVYELSTFSKAEDHDSRTVDSTAAV